jgi:CDP-2,3-bis-(O-geranylgeranyl)-sn-glycerol synthase
VIQYTIIGQLLVLLVVANGAPIIARNLLGTRGNWPVDFGCVFVDRRPLLGPSKTIRGVLAAVCATGIVAFFLDVPFVIGALFGLYTMVGDLVASFLKRRLGLPSSDSALGLDQGLEALCPVLLLQQYWSLRFADIVAVVVAFFVLEIVLSRVLYKLHIRQRAL